MKRQERKRRRRERGRSHRKNRQLRLRCFQLAIGARIYFRRGAGNVMVGSLMHHDEAMRIVQLLQAYPPNDETIERLLNGPW